MFISNDRASFHLWRKENLAKHRKVSKYYEIDCSHSNIMAEKSLNTFDDFGARCVYLPTREEECTSSS